MAGGVPIVYRSGSGNLTFSVDYFDYVSNAGYKKFYAGASNMSGAAIYFLTNQTVPTGQPLTNYFEAGAATVTKNFDLTFNNPAQTANANALLEFTKTITGAGKQYIQAIVYHVRGATATEIGNKYLAPSTSGPFNARESMLIPIASQAFSVGDILRLTLSLTDVDNHASRIYIDPDNRATMVETTSGATIGTDCVLLMPFKIDL